VAAIALLPGCIDRCYVQLLYTDVSDRTGARLTRHNADGMLLLKMIDNAF